MKKWIGFALALCLGWGSLHATTMRIRFEEEKNRPEVDVFVDHPEGWIKKEVSSWDLLFENKEQSDVRIGFHCFIDPGFNVKDVGEVMEYFNWLCEPLYTSKKELKFSSNNKSAMCRFIGKTELDEELSVSLFTFHDESMGLILTWMETNRDSEKLGQPENNPTKLLDAQIYY